MMWNDNSKKKDSQGEGENFTFLGREVTFHGVVTFDGTVRIDSRFEGEIHAKGTLVVAEHAVIKGIITAGTLICNGKIKGTITASEKVQLLKSGVLIGEVHAPSFLIEEGAHFQGLCDMGPMQWADEEPQAIENVHDLTAHRSKVLALAESESGM